MTNAVNTTKVVSGLSHHRSDRSVLSSMRALVRPRTPASVDAIATSVAPVNPQCGSQYESQVNPGVRGVALAATHEKTTQHTRKRKGARHDHRRRPLTAIRIFSAMVERVDLLFLTRVAVATKVTVSF